LQEVKAIFVVQSIMRLFCIYRRTFWPQMTCLWTTSMSSWPCQ